MSFCQPWLTPVGAPVADLRVDFCVTFAYHLRHADGVGNGLGNNVVALW